MTPLLDREAANLPRHDWSARARSSALEALRYTKFVGVAKRALQVAAFAVIAAGKTTITGNYYAELIKDSVKPGPNFP